MFVIFLQFTMAWERRPFDRLRTPLAGPAALLLAAVVAVIAYELLVNWASLPLTDRPPGLRDPGGPISGSDVSTFMMVVAAWQVVVMVVALGYPGRLAHRTVSRIVINNVTIVAGSSITIAVADSIRCQRACAIGGSRLRCCRRPTPVQPLPRRAGSPRRDVDPVPKRARLFGVSLHRFELRRRCGLTRDPATCTMGRGGGTEPCQRRHHLRELLCRRTACTCER